MIIDASMLLKCPKCSSVKKVRGLISGNTFGSVYWSDTKREHPMLPRISPIQKCMNCGAYFFISDADKKRGTEYSFDLGLLSLEECKEAIEQLTAEGITKKKEFTLCRETLLRFNDIYYRSDDDSKRNTPCEEDLNFFEENAERFLEIIGDIEEWQLLKAEILREIGRFDECITLLTEAQGSLSNLSQERSKHIKEEILKRAKEKDNIVCKL